MTEYLLLIYEDEARANALAPESDAALVEEFHRFTARHRGAVTGGRRLRPTSEAVSVRSGPDGGVRVSDGAFVESKEVVAGYFVIRAEDLDEAVEIARRVPVPHGGVEVRPLRPAPDA